MENARTMFTIIGADGKEYGPVSADKIREWIASGRANAQTQCRREGETAWSTLGSLGDFAGAFATNPPPLSAATPAPPKGPVPSRHIDTKAYADAIEAGGARVDVFECLSRSFNLWTSNFLPLVGGTLLIVLVQFLIGFVPLLGALAGLFLNGVFYGGLYYFYLGKIRQEHREIGDVFAGFTRAFGPLVLCSLIQTGIMLVIGLIFMAPLFTFFVARAGWHGGEAALPVLSAPMIALICVGSLLMLYLGVSLIFSFVLVIDKGLTPWDAIVTSWRVVTRNWFAVFFTLLLGLIITMLGVIALFVGVLLTLPLMLGALLYAYESLFNTPQANAALEAHTRAA